MTYTFNQLKSSYTPLWDGLVIIKDHETKAEAAKLLKYKSVYQRLEAKTGVPWFAIGIIHTREAGSVDVGRWQCILHNGERIVGTGRKSRLVPSGKGPFATFEAAALDALAGYRGQTWSVELLAYTLERFNGFGYRSKHIPSPYLWGGTNKQKRGKYVSDGNYDPNTMDPQIGGMALLLELMALDPSVSFAPKTETSSAPEVTATPQSQDVSTLNTSKPVVEPAHTTSPKVTLPQTQKGLVGSILAGLTAAQVAVHSHRLEIVGVAVLAVAVVLAYHYWLKPKLWTNPSPKAHDQADVGEAVPQEDNTHPVVAVPELVPSDTQVTAGDKGN